LNLKITESPNFQLLSNRPTVISSYWFVHSPLHGTFPHSIFSLIETIKLAGTSKESILALPDYFLLAQFWMDRSLEDNPWTQLKKTIFCFFPVHFLFWIFVNIYDRRLKILTFLSTLSVRRDGLLLKVTFPLRIRIFPTSLSSEMAG